MHVKPVPFISGMWVKGCHGCVIITYHLLFSTDKDVSAWKRSGKGLHYKLDIML
jgi:hypothetical protein